MDDKYCKDILNLYIILYMYSLVSLLSNICYSTVTVESISSYKRVKNNVIVTPCSVSLAIRQSPDKTGYLTQHRKPPRFKGIHLSKHDIVNIILINLSKHNIVNIILIKVINLSNICLELHKLATGL